MFTLFPVRSPFAPAPAARRFGLPALLALTVALTPACGDGAAGPDDAGEASADGAGDPDDAASAGTYRAYFVFPGPNGQDTSDVIEGDLAAPIAAADMVEVALPEHGDRLRFSNTRWPLPYGLENSSFLLSYREPDGDRAIYSTSFDTPRFEVVDVDSADVRAVAIAPMWASEAREHTMSVHEATEPYDSLGAFTVTAPADEANVTQLDGSAIADIQSAYLVLETHWNDGRARSVVMAYRGSGGSWWAKAMTPDPRAVPQEGVQSYNDGVFVEAAHPAVFIVGLEE